MKTPAPLVSPVIPARWRARYRALLRARRTLLGERATRAAELQAPHEVGGTDSAERAAQETESAELLAELESERVELNEVEAALARIEAGTYGKCELTGKPIAPSRLRALPWTRLSAAAARKLAR